MSDLAKYGLKEVNRSIPNKLDEPVDQRFELRCIVGHAFVAWFRVVKREDRSYEIDPPVRIIRHPELSEDQLHAARRWLVEKAEFYANCTRIEVMAA